MSDNKINSDLSPNQKAIRRLLKNRLAVAGMVIIFLATLIAILGYLITPDFTADANDQVNEVNLKQPGFTIKMLKVRKNRNFPKDGLINTIINGRPNHFQMIPMNSFEINDGFVEAMVYQGEGVPGKLVKYSLADIVFPLSASNEEVEYNNQQIGYYPIDHKKIKQPLAELKDRVLNQNIVTKTFPKGINKDGYEVISATEVGTIQYNDLTNKPPGFSATLLKVRKNGINQTLASSQEVSDNSFEWRAIEQPSLKKDSLYARVFSTKKDSLGQLVPGELLALNLVNILYSQPENGQLVEVMGDELAFYTNDQPKTVIFESELKSTVEKDHIINKTYYFGTDGFGRCLLSRLLIGVRISLSVGLIAVLISLTIGIFLGAVAGYLGGKVDDLIMLLINTMWSVPTLLLVFALVIALGRGYWQIFTAVGLTMWVDVARIVRGQVISLRKVQFVEAATSLGFGNTRIIMRHILPNILGPVMVIAAVNFAAAILIEAGLSYLGFGIQPPKPSWGTMLSENYSFLLMGGNPFPALVPGFAIMILVLAFNLVGNGFRDALDVKSRL